MKKIDLSGNEKESIKPAQKQVNSFKVGPWSLEEHDRFLKAIRLYGNSWAKIQWLVKTRSCSQIRMYCSHFLQKLRINIRQRILNTHFASSQVIDIPNNEMQEIAMKKEDGIIERLVIEELEKIRKKEESEYEDMGDVMISLETYYMREYLKGQ